jgi:hypothetical protein
MAPQKERDKQSKWEPWGSSIFIEVDKNSDKARIGCLGKLILFIFSAAGLVIGLVALIVAFLILKAIFI